MEKLTDKTRIYILLQRLVDKRALLTIKLKDKNQAYTSAILEVNRDDNFIILDELKPEEGDRLLRKDPALHIDSYLDGVNLRFNAKVSDFGIDNNIPFYKLSIPAALDYHQRRQAVRIRLSAANPIPITFTTDEGKSFNGEIEDISIGGLRARFRQNLAHTLEAGAKIKCTFLLPPDKREKLNCEFIIRVIKHDKNKIRPAFLGGQFVDLEKSIERDLQRMIMSLQRATRQKDAF